MKWKNHNKRSIGFVEELERDFMASICETFAIDVNVDLDRLGALFRDTMDAARFVVNTNDSSLLTPDHETETDSDPLLWM
uniref:Uncharacterized protein n=1 Tax=Cucumis melo TaxID=3656 RepID=A0A9I9E5Y6_CUCME